MLDEIAAPSAALAFALTIVFAAGAVGIARTRHDPNRRAALLIIVLVLTFVMAASVVVFRPVEAGDMVEEQRHH